MTASLVIFKVIIPQNFHLVKYFVNYLFTKTILIANNKIVF